MIEDIQIREVDHRQPEVFAPLHALQMAAYAQEADLLDVHEFPPLAVTQQQLAQQAARYFCLFQGEQICAALALETLADAQHYLIASLVVAPEQQRKGFARRLLQAVLQHFPQHCFQVSTASLNLPACQLYLSSGFRQKSKRKVHLQNGKTLQLVKFSRAPQHKLNKNFKKTPI